MLILESNGHQISAYKPVQKSRLNSLKLSNSKKDKNVFPILIAYSPPYLGLYLYIWNDPTQSLVHKILCLEKI